MGNSNITSGLYSLFRIGLGMYLCIHFAHLIPWAMEVFGQGGLISTPHDSPFIGILPNPLALFDNQWVLHSLLLIGSACGLLIAAGKWDLFAAIASAVILAWLYQRNPLIANPSLPLVGWMLLAHSFVKQTGIGTLKSAANATPNYSWRLPNSIWLAAWIVLAIAYSYSGYTKLLSPSWVDGSAISIVLENPLARDHFLRSLLLSFDPWVLQWLTWGVTAIELIFLVLILYRPLRIFVWTFMLFVQFGFLVFLNFADLTFPMLLIHLLTFDPDWIKSKVRSNDIIFYDGTCALCHGVIRLILSEQSTNQYRFSPLQGKSFKTFLTKKQIENLPDSFIVFTDNKEILLEGKAVVYILRSLGGFWFILGSILNVFPNAFLNYGYRFVAKIRIKIFGNTKSLCPILPVGLREQFLN